jgi:hypothetical protein
MSPHELVQSFNLEGLVAAPAGHPVPLEVQTCDFEQRLDGVSPHQPGIWHLASDL